MALYDDHRLGVVDISLREAKSERSNARLTGNRSFPQILLAESARKQAHSALDRAAVGYKRLAFAILLNSLYKRQRNLNIDEDKFREAFLREASHLLQVPYVRLHGGDANAR